MPAPIQSVPIPTRKTDSFWEKSFLLAVMPPARIAAAWFMSCTMTAAAEPYFFEGISLKNNSNAVGVPICGVFPENGWIRA